MTRPAVTPPSADLPRSWSRSIARLVRPWFQGAASDRSVTRSEGRLDEPAIERAVALREELVALVRSWDLELGEAVRDDTSLIKSGVFDSLALWNLLLWVEKQIGRPVDPTSFDLIEEWDTVADVVRFLERQPATGRSP